MELLVSMFGAVVVLMLSLTLTNFVIMVGWLPFAWIVPVAGCSAFNIVFPEACAPAATRVAHVNKEIKRFILNLFWTLTLYINLAWLQDYVLIR